MKRRGGHIHSQQPGFDSWWNEGYDFGVKDDPGPSLEKDESGGRLFGG